VTLAVLVLRASLSPSPHADKVETGIKEKQLASAAKPLAARQFFSR